MAPLVLPAVTAVLAPQISTDPTDVLSGGRVTSFRFDLLDGKENLIGALDNVEVGGSVTWHALTAVKATGSITVVDVHEPQVDWLNVRVRPVALISAVGGGALDLEVPCGVFLPAAPVETWTANGRTWAVELIDKLSILDQDDVVDQATGTAQTYAAPVGTSILAAVVALIAATGEPTPAITVLGSKTLTTAMTWVVGTTRLQIANDLLAAGGYFSLWCDGAGQFRTTPYVAPGLRVPVYSLLTPFSKGDLSLMSPAWTNDRQIYAIPNRYVAVGQGSGTTAALTSVATNMNPASPFSYPRRGRWITRTVTGVEAVDQATLDTRAAQGLAQSTSVTTGLTVNHVWLPDLAVNSVVRFTNPDAGLDLLCEVGTTSLVFNPTALSQSTLREVVV